MGAPKFKVTLKQQRKAHSALFSRFKRGEVPTVTIVQEKGTGKVLVVATNYETAAKELDRLGLKDAPWDIDDHFVKG